jgi:hypothetical protein
VKQDQIEAEIIAARERLAKNLSELEYAMSPAGITERGKDFAKKFFTDSEGQIKIERVIGSVVGTLVGLKIIRKIF